MAHAYYSEARAIFMAHGELDKARIVAEAVDQIGREILSLPATNGARRAHHVMQRQIVEHRLRHRTGAVANTMERMLFASSSLMRCIVALAVGVVASIVGGALGGVAIGGKALGNELAAMLGGFYGPLAGIAGIVVGLFVLAI